MNLFNNWFKSAEEKRDEALSAYVDNALRGQERTRFEQQLAEDANLQAELAQQRLIKSSFSRLPRRRAPRNFTLNANVYGRSQPETTTWLYPAMRAATLVTAFFFIFAVAIEMLGSPLMGDAPLSSVAMERMDMPEVAQDQAAPPSAVESIPLTEEEGDMGILVSPEVAEEIPESGAAPAPMMQQREDEEAASEPSPVDMASRLAATPEIELQVTSPIITGEIEVDTEALLYSEPSLSEKVEPQFQDPAPRPPLRVAQVGLGVGFILLALSTFLLRRRL